MLSSTLKPCLIYSVLNSRSVPDSYTTNTHPRPERNGDLHMSDTASAASASPVYTYRDLKKQLDTFTDSQLDDQVCVFDHDCGETLAVDRMVDPIARADNPITGRDYAATMIINEDDELWVKTGRKELLSKLPKSIFGEQES